MSTPPVKPPEILDKIVDIVLAHRIKPKQRAAKKRKPSSEKPAKKNSKPTQ